MVPVAAASDGRLGKNDLRVLIALLAHADKCGMCHPKRETISQMTQIRKQTVSNITTNLVRLGWLEKKGKGGFSQASRYRVTVPKACTVTDESTVPEPCTVPKPRTVRVSSTSTVPDSSTSTVPDSGTRIEQTNEQTNEQKKNIRHGIDYSGLPVEIPKSVAQEFVQHRKNLKKPLTQEAFERQMKAAVKAGDQLGISPEKTIHETIDAGWQGIKGDWLANRIKPKGKKHGNFDARNYQGTPEHEIDWLND
jgi:hypothetical protein